MELPITFPSEAEQLRRQLKVYAGATPGERLQAVADTLAAVEALSNAGGRSEQQGKYQDACERQGRDRMKEFIAKHLSATGVRLAMPEISRFFGISIRMYFDDHHPPHLHAIYGDKEAEVGIDPIALLRGRFPRRALGMVVEWAAAHQQELLEDWELVHSEQAPRWIDPLE